MTVFDGTERNVADRIFTRLLVYGVCLPLTLNAQSTSRALRLLCVTVFPFWFAVAGLPLTLLMLVCWLVSLAVDSWEERRSLWR